MWLILWEVDKSVKFFPVVYLMQPYFGSCSKHNGAQVWSSGYEESDIEISGFSVLAPHLGGETRIDMERRNYILAIALCISVQSNRLPGENVAKVNEWQNERTRCPNCQTWLNTGLRTSPRRGRPLDMRISRWRAEAKRLFNSLKLRAAGRGNAPSTTVERRVQRIITDDKVSAFHCRVEHHSLNISMLYYNAFTNVPWYQTKIIGQHCYTAVNAVNAICNRRNSTRIKVNKKSQSNLGTAASPPFTAENNFVTAPTGYTTMPHIYPQNCSFTVDDLHIHLMHPSLDQPHSPSPQTASRSTQPFFHNSATELTDRARRRACTNTRLRSIDCIATRLIIMFVTKVDNFIYDVPVTI